MFFGGVDEKARKLNGLIFPHPALIFKVAGRDLFVRAAATNSRPDSATPLKTAPIGTLTFESAPAVCVYPTLLTRRRYHRGKTHSSIGIQPRRRRVRFTSHPEEFIGLWRNLAGKKRFPGQYLTDAGETLQEFVAPANEREELSWKIHRIHPELLERQVRVLVVVAENRGAR